jgi:uncharacterized protein YbaR (Trm112 family)
MNDEMLKLFCCPETHQPVRQAEQALIQQLNQKIASGTLRDHSGKTVKDPLDAGLLRQDGKILFPIRREVIVMLMTEGIPLD